MLATVGGTHERAAPLGFGFGLERGVCWQEFVDRVDILSCAVLCHPLQVISRAMGLPIERPKSWTTDGLINKFNLKL